MSYNDSTEAYEDQAETIRDLLDVLDDIGRHAVANNHGSFNVSADRIREVRKIVADHLPR